MAKGSQSSLHKPLQIITHRTRGGGTVSHSANRKAELKLLGEQEEEKEGGVGERGKKIDSHTRIFACSE